MRSTEQVNKIILQVKRKIVNIMAKRSNPYVEDFVTQSKVYIGMRKILNNNETNLKKVYEKTLELLYQGAKKSNLQEIPNNPDSVSLSKEKMKQLCIGKDGSLVHSEAATVEKHPAGPCGCGKASEAQCAYCETALCYSCQQGCSVCLKLHCSRCTILGCEDSQMCVSCYG